jgi:hypothetical protein
MFFLHFLFMLDDEKNRPPDDNIENCPASKAGRVNRSSFASFFIFNQCEFYFQFLEYIRYQKKIYPFFLLEKT